MKNTWRFDKTELKYLREVIDSGFASSTSGNMNKRFEEAFSKKVGSKYAITFNSGTGTLQAALHACGVGYGDEVITTPLTVISNLYVILAQNAIPIFADVDEETFNIDPKSIEKKISKRTKAIIPVALYGLCCDMDPIMEIARKKKIPVIMDAAEAHMAKYKNIPIAKIADITSYSTENSKQITTGDGGIVVTNNEKYAIKMRKFGSLGYASLPAKDGRIRRMKDIFQDPNYKRHDNFGYNFRMPEVAAALGLAQTEKIDYFIDLRIKIANLYEEAIKNCDYLIPQKKEPEYLHTYWTWTCKFENKKISWKEFRNKFVEFGGDGIYAAWSLLYDETFFSSNDWKNICPPLYNDLKYDKPICPNAEKYNQKLCNLLQILDH